MMRFVFPKSHAFPGGRVLVDEDANATPEGLAEFGDGTTVIVEWRRLNEGIHLAVPAYRTARGTRVDARDWHLVQRKDGEWRSERRRTPG